MTSAASHATSLRLEREGPGFKITSIYLPDGNVVVTPLGELDLSAGSALRRALADAVDGGNAAIVVDLEGATFVDSVTLGVLLGAARAVRRRNGTLRVVCVDANIRRIFELTLLDQVFDLYASRAEALAHRSER
jgi:anti-sigma B factor antagonist